MLSSNAAYYWVGSHDMLFPFRHHFSPPTL